MDYFCSILLKKIVLIKVTAELGAVAKRFRLVLEVSLLICFFKTGHLFFSFFFTKKHRLI